MIPVAVGLILGSRAAVVLGERIGTKLAVAGGLGVVAVGMQILSRAEVDSGYGLVATALVVMGFGLAVAMTPATEAIMGSLPKEKAGVGSAMNDVLRELGATLGVAVLGSILASRYAGGMGGSTSGLPTEAADASVDSVDGAHAVAAQLGDSASGLVSTADQAFVTAMGTTTDVAAAVALVGALVALVFLPARANRIDDEITVVEAEVGDPAERVLV
jgi:hypothetical protein